MHNEDDKKVVSGVSDSVLESIRKSQSLNEIYFNLPTISGTWNSSTPYFSTSQWNAISSGYPYPVAAMPPQKTAHTLELDRLSVSAATKASRVKTRDGKIHSPWKRVTESGNISNDAFTFYGAEPWGYQTRCGKRWRKGMLWADVEGQAITCPRCAMESIGDESN